METNEIKPIELCINADEVIKRYQVTDAMEIVRCKTAIFFHSTCFWVVSKPTLANNLQGGALYETLRWYCDYMDAREEYSEEDREKYDTIASAMVMVLTLPLDVFTDQELFFGIANSILDKRNEFYERLQKEAEEPREETEADALENANFEGEILAQQALAKDLEEMAKQEGNGDADSTAS